MARVHTYTAIRMTTRYRSPRVVGPRANVRFSLMVVGDREAERLSLGDRRVDVLKRQRHGQQEDRADEAPTARSPRARRVAPAGWRRGLFAERPGRIEAVDDEQGHEHADQERPRTSCLCRTCWCTKLNRIAGHWWLAKNSRIRAKTTIPMISAPTPMLLIVVSSRTPNVLMIVLEDEGDLVRRTA